MLNLIKQKPKVKFIANNLEEEKRIVKLTKEKREWFEKNKYRFTLPNKSLKAIYEKENYLKKTDKIKTEWLKQEKKFFSALKDFFAKGFKKEIVVHISKYGVGGGYDLPNHVYMNISLHYNQIKTIQHEILHLVIELFIQKYKINHRKKEKIVDCLLELFE